MSNDKDPFEGYETTDLYSIQEFLEKYEHDVLAPLLEIIAEFVDEADGITVIDPRELVNRLKQAGYELPPRKTPGEAGSA